MSSSNLVSLTYVEETDYGVEIPAGAGVTLTTCRFTDESLSGTPQTTESTEIRTDRMSSGMVATGLDVNGDINFELSPDVFFDDFFRGGMLSTWVPEVSESNTISLTPTGSQTATLTTTGDWSNLNGYAVQVGDLITLVPDAGGDKVIVQVISVDSTTDLTVATSRDEEAITTVLTTVAVPAYLEIGSEIVSFQIGKAYQDVTHLLTTDEHSQTYNGEIVSGFTVNSQWGEIVTGTYSTLGNGYKQEHPSYAQQVETAGGTINPAGTSDRLNASIDVPLVTTDGLATEFCIQNFTITLDNGLTPVQCIGKAEPTGYTMGTARITIDASIYLSDTSYDSFMPGKENLDPLSMTFTMMNDSEGYAFQMPAVQLSFPDPASEGQDAQTMINAQGAAKVGDNGESALRIYKL